MFFCFVFSSHLKEILGRWNSYLEAKEKVQLKISEISQQKLDLSVEFVWPDLTGKYESLEKCRMLLQEAHSILTAFDMLKVQKDALFHLTHDVNFNEASWVEMLNPNYCLLKDLKVCTQYKHMFFSLVPVVMAT